MFEVTGDYDMVPAFVFRCRWLFYRGGHILGFLSALLLIVTAILPLTAEAVRADQCTKDTCLDRGYFYSKYRKSYGGLTERKVLAINALLDYWDTQKELNDKRWLAYIFATALHETASKVYPVRECLCGSDACAVKCTKGLWRKGIAKPYYRRDPKTKQSYYGRGQIQVTLKSNYYKVGGKLGFGDKLVWKPDMALDPKISGTALIRGMVEGWYTRKRLSHYFTRSKTNWHQARRIVNGTFHADRVAKHGRKFVTFIRTVPASQFVADEPEPETEEEPPAVEEPVLETDDVKPLPPGVGIEESAGSEQGAGTEESTDVAQGADIADDEAVTPLPAPDNDNVAPDGDAEQAQTSMNKPIAETGAVVPVPPGVAFEEQASGPETQAAEASDEAETAAEKPEADSVPAKPAQQEEAVKPQAEDQSQPVTPTPPAAPAPAEAEKPEAATEAETGKPQAPQADTETTEQDAADSAQPSGTEPSGAQQGGTEPKPAPQPETAPPAAPQSAPGETQPKAPTGETETGAGDSAGGKAVEEKPREKSMWETIQSYGKKFIGYIWRFDNEE